MEHTHFDTSRYQFFSDNAESQATMAASQVIAIEELALKIFYFTDFKTGQNICKTCKYFNRIGSDPLLFNKQIFDLILQKALVGSDSITKKEIVLNLLKKGIIEKSEELMNTISDPSILYLLHLELAKAKLHANPLCPIQFHLDEAFALYDATGRSDKKGFRFKALNEIANLQIETNRTEAKKTLELAQQYIFYKSKPNEQPKENSNYKKYIAFLLFKLDREEAIAFTYQIQCSSTRSHIFSFFIKEIAKNEGPEKGKELFRRFFPPEQPIEMSIDLIGALCSIAKEQIKTDKEAAHETLREALNVPFSENHLIPIIQILALIDPKLTLEKASQASNQMQKAQYHYSIAEAIAETNKPHALQLLKQALEEINQLASLKCIRDLLKKIALLNIKLDGEKAISILPINDKKDCTQLIEKASLQKYFDIEGAKETLEQAYSLLSVTYRDYRNDFVDNIKQIASIDFEFAYSKACQFAEPYKSTILEKLVLVKAETDVRAAIQLASTIVSENEKKRAFAMLLAYLPIK